MDEPPPIEPRSPTPFGRGPPPPRALQAPRRPGPGRGRYRAAGPGAARCGAERGRQGARRGAAFVAVGAFLYISGGRARARFGSVRGFCGSARPGTVRREDGDEEAAHVGAAQ